jgi:hypothetical protein
MISQLQEMRDYSKLIKPAMRFITFEVGKKPSPPE